MPAPLALLSSLPEIVSIEVAFAAIFVVEEAVAGSGVVLVGVDLWGTRYCSEEVFGAVGVLRRGI